MEFVGLVDGHLGPIQGTSVDCSLGNEAKNGSGQELHKSLVGSFRCRSSLVGPLECLSIIRNRQSPHVQSAGAESKIDSSA
jgi:hypothetical protein